MRAPLYSYICAPPTRQICWRSIKLCSIRISQSCWKFRRLRSDTYILSSVNCKLQVTMKVLICLAVLLTVGSFPSGEALKCRVCRSKNETDDCTANPLLIGAVPCGKYEYHLIIEKLKSFKSLLTNITREKNGDLKIHDNEMTADVEKLMDKHDDFYVPTISNHTADQLNSSIVEFKMAYKDYQASAKKIEDFEAIKKEYMNEESKISKNSTKLDNFFTILQAIDKSIIENSTMAINEALSAMTNWETAEYIELEEKVNNALTIVNNSGVLLASLSLQFRPFNVELLNNLDIENDDIMSEISDVRAAVKLLNETSYRWNLSKYSLINVWTILNNTATGDVIAKNKIIKNVTPDLRSFIGNSTVLKNKIETFVNFTANILTYKIKINTNLAYVQRRIETAMILLEEARKMTKYTLFDLNKKTEKLTITIEAAINGVSKSVSAKKWMCFTEFQGNGMVNRGCTDKSIKTMKKKVNLCKQDGCNSSSNISIQFITIFAALGVVALGSTR